MIANTNGYIPSMKFVEFCRSEIAAAAANRAKTRTIHFLALIHAEEIASYGVPRWCRDVDIEASWELEVRKMLDVADELRINKMEIVGVS